VERGTDVGIIPLLKGEGGAKRRVRGKEMALFLYPSSGPSGHLLPSGEGFVFSQIEKRMCES